MSISNSLEYIYAHDAPYRGIYGNRRSSGDKVKDCTDVDVLSSIPQSDKFNSALKASHQYILGADGVSTPNGEVSLNNEVYELIITSAARNRLKQINSNEEYARFISGYKNEPLKCGDPTSSELPISRTSRLLGSRDSVRPSLLEAASGITRPVRTLGRVIGYDSEAMRAKGVKSLRGVDIDLPRLYRDWDGIEFVKNLKNFDPSNGGEIPGNPLNRMGIIWNTNAIYSINNVSVSKRVLDPSGCRATHANLLCNNASGPSYITPMNIHTSKPVFSNDERIAQAQKVAELIITSTPGKNSYDALKDELMSIKDINDRKTMTNLAREVLLGEKTGDNTYIGKDFIIGLALAGAAKAFPDKASIVANSGVYLGSEATKWLVSQGYKILKYATRTALFNPIPSSAVIGTLVGAGYSENIKKKATEALSTPGDLYNKWMTGQYSISSLYGGWRSNRVDPNLENL